MDFSKVKLEVYDFLGILIPGALALGLVAYLLLPTAAWTANKVGTPGALLTLFLLGAFAAGQIVQEASDWLVRRLRGPRYLKRCRDDFWTTSEAEAVRSRISTECGISAVGVDMAFDYCLSSIGAGFAKRDTFLAISDMARSIWCLSIFAIVAGIVHYSRLSGGEVRSIFVAKFAVAEVAIVCLSWRRMVRFRTLSEAPVFATFLALPKRLAAESKGAAEESES